MLRMHKLIILSVAVATFPAFPALAAPPDNFKFYDRPILKELNMNPAYTDLFKPLRSSSIQPNFIQPISFTGISQSGNVPLAHLVFGGLHSFAKLGDLLPDGSKLVSIDIQRGDITTTKNNNFSTYTLHEYE